MESLNKKRIKVEGIGGKGASGHGHLVEEIVQGQIRIPSNREPEVCFEHIS